MNHENGVHPHDHAHPHDHDHLDDHGHPHAHDGVTHVHAASEGFIDSPAANLDIPESELSPRDRTRRTFLLGAGVIGAGIAASTVIPGSAAAIELPGRAARHDDGDFVWLAGDHHTHTQYSPDGQYRVADHVQHATAYGLDWLVITDHGSAQHSKIGVEKVNPDIRAARDAFSSTLVFQGLEWNIPAAEHGTVFVHPGPNEVAVLKEFENAFDGVVKNATASTTANETLALEGLDFLSTSVRTGRVRDALFLANHPARKGLDSPHEIRGWRDRAPEIAVGFEGAPGHQAAGLPLGAASGRGFYDNAPSSASFAAYPPESYRTWGGFDWMTSTVGGLWDSLLAEGLPWWITANSDSHSVYLDDAVRGPNSDFATNGYYNDPVHGPAPVTSNGDFWPGYYSRTHIGARRRTYAGVIDGLRAGRVWVDHGRLVESVSVRAFDSARAGRGGRGVTLGGSLFVRRGANVRVVIDITTASLPNWAQFVPELAKVDVIQGDFNGAVQDRDVFTTPSTKVTAQYDVSGRKGRFRIVYLLNSVESPVYVRLRGSDGKRTAPGALGAKVDPAGPALDVVGDADPWNDLWFYTNPIFILPRR